MIQNLFSLTVILQSKEGKGVQIGIEDTIMVGVLGIKMELMVMKSGIVTMILEKVATSWMDTQVDMKVDLKMEGENGEKITMLRKMRITIRYDPVLFSFLLAFIFVLAISMNADRFFFFQTNPKAQLIIPKSPSLLIK